MDIDFFTDVHQYFKVAATTVSSMKLVGANMNYLYTCTVQGYCVKKVNKHLRSINVFLKVGFTLKFNISVHAAADPEHSAALHGIAVGRKVYSTIIFISGCNLYFCVN